MTDHLAKAKRVVIKTGSALVTNEAGAARADWLARLAADIAAWRRAGRDIVWVSSGAVALGRSGLTGGRPRRLEDKQAAAALGQPLLMGAIANAFAAHGLRAAQALLTLEDTEQRRRWLNARATLETLLEAEIVPVINENDTVATEELRYGDNDRLAARVAQMISADLLVLLSDVDGLYTADPRYNPQADHIASLTEIDSAVEAMAHDVKNASGVGSGGMATKLAAAKIAHGAGCMTVITLGDRETPLGALETSAQATWIVPRVSPDTARRTWLKGHLTPEGAVIVDKGAEAALMTGASLLPVGVKAVEGRFDRGAAIAVKSVDGGILAKGITAYSADDIARIAGRHSEEVEGLLGVARRPAIIHRDDLVFA